MLTLRTGLIVTVAALLAGAVTAADAHAQSSAGAARPALAAGTGIAVLQTAANLSSDGAWTGTPLEARLPGPGTYEVDADVRGRLGGAPPIDTWITARLWNVTSGAEVPNSERLVYQAFDVNRNDTLAAGNQTVTISELIEVTRPETIQLQARYTNSVGAASSAQVYSDGNGYTTLRYVWVGS